MVGVGGTVVGSSVVVVGIAVVVAAFSVLSGLARERFAGSTHPELVHTLLGRLGRADMSFDPVALCCQDVQPI